MVCVICCAYDGAVRVACRSFSPAKQLELLLTRFRTANLTAGGSTIENLQSNLAVFAAFEAFAMFAEFSSFF